MPRDKLRNLDFGGDDDDYYDLEENVTADRDAVVQWMFLYPRESVFGESVAYRRCCYCRHYYVGSGP